MPARFCASAWLNWPVIWVVPKIGPWIVGAETTSPSSTKATFLPTFFDV